MAAAQPGARYSGWWKDPINNRLAMYYAGTKVGHVTASAVSFDKALTSVLGFSATTTVTAGTGLTVTTGNATVTAGDANVTAGNYRAGVVSAFGTTEPTSAVVMKAGTAPAGAITTSCGVFTDGTTLKKIIAASTVSDIQT